MQSNETFPLHTGGSINLVWSAPSGLQKATGISFVLRCAEEWTETTGTGKHRRTHLIHEQLWAAERKTEGPVDCRPDLPIPLAFDVPSTAPGSRLSEKQAITFWELDVQAKAPGVDFSERYLVPIYAINTQKDSP